MSALQQMMMAGNGPTTWNPVDKHANISLSGSNLTATKTTSDALRSVRATKGINSGKRYFEVRMDSGNTTADFCLIGVANSSADLSTFIGANVNGWAYYQDTGEKYTNNIAAAYGTSWVNTNVIGVAYDADSGKVWFSKNGTWQNSGDPAAGTGEAFSGITGFIFPAISLYAITSGAHVMTGRFILSSFTTAPPSGFSAWGA